MWKDTTRSDLQPLFVNLPLPASFHCKIFMADIEFRINDCYDHSGAVAVCPVISYRRQVPAATSARRFEECFVEVGVDFCSGVFSKKSR